ncbi:tRNA dihydrouridine synthase [Clostridium perfringens]|uniref:tRNA-dihydrouridine synthase n=1 Tax=Clostridium perfringens (strain SM101 / Type A) TaxID=289380 RepID=Q0STG2_CLOPS|nr:tRNA-dihydrouridine synthase family protein [Clostridium perfringens]ABG85804.1 dihydrouridine synthase family protein [Clostridium perfringens SM101]EJT5915653.1 tRNA-dihydrouridine synthase family protein [Clostridium perfringens]EJT6134698.1 tRNA-dihydrouridine synthase family protein [Clostridium perfringens]EJT6150057.1 tRNA-dihydrouridine synthase family protein [Clostridium perfringens]EJT6155679.1 tRNA-dihydrouridine synthase family protein [Clostridium perfringens]
MKYYLAPMEGITGFIYRNSYEKFFGGIDKYFAPFVVPNSSKSLKTKELRDVLPENNKGINLVPQILTNDSEGFILTAKKLKDLGYNEINLNLGCPSGTVVGKKRGAGFLAHREELDKFLEEIFKINHMKISIKTRLGMDKPEEFYELIKIYNKYPMEELIIHPRTRQDFYGNKPNLEVFKDAISLSKNPVCYNGDIFTLEDHNKLVEEFKEVDKIMLGRGILANPALMNEILNNEFMDKKVLKEFHDEIFSKYREVFNEDRNAMFRMKELWGYMIYMFSNNKKYAKKIKKAQKVVDYNQAVTSLFLEQDILKGAGLFSSEE